MKDHFIPCLLLARFSVDGSTGRKARVYQFRRDGPRPSNPVPAKDLAYAGNFYERSDFPNLDEAGLRQRETTAADLIRDLIDGADPQQHAGQITSLFLLQGARTKAFREGTAERVGMILDKAMDAWGKPCGLDHMRRLLDQEMKHSGVDILVRLGFPREVAALVLAQFGEARLKQIIKEGLTSQSLSDVLAQLHQVFAGGGIANAMIAKAQVKGLHTMVSRDGSEHPFCAARWIRIDSPNEPLILGDSCVVGVGADGSTGWLFKYGKGCREVYLPIGRHVAIVGLSPDGPNVPSLDASSLNRASAELARDYIYASRCTSAEKDLAARIGSVEPLMTDAEMDEMIDDSMREHAPGKASESG